MTCVPADSARLKLPPLPIVPSRLDVQVILDVSVPSSTSSADPENRIVVAAVYEVPPSGELMRTAGAVFVGAGADAATVTVT